MAKNKKQRRAARTALAPRTAVAPRTASIRNASVRATAAQAGRATYRAARSVARRAGKRAVAMSAPAPAWQEVLCLAGGAVGSAVVGAMVRQKGWFDADTIAYAQTGVGIAGALMAPGLARFAFAGMGAGGAVQVVYIQAQSLAAERMRKKLEGSPAATAATTAPAKPGERPQAALPESFDHQFAFQQHLTDDAARLTDESVFAPQYAPQYAHAA
jgi:hypothetical protein